MARRSVAAIAGLLLGFAAVASYFTVVITVLGPRWPGLRDTPVLNLAMLAVALWLSVVGIRRALADPARRGRWLAVACGTLNLVLAGFFVLFLFRFSTALPAATRAPRVGDVAPDFTLLDQTSKSVQLATLRGRNVLLVFYRGFW